MRGLPIKKGQRLSPETEFQKGLIPWMKGRKHSEETRKKMSEARANKVPWNKGKKRPPFSKEWREKMSLAAKGKKVSMETRKKMSEWQKGEKSWRWQGGISSFQNLMRNRMEYINWRKAVYQRDNFTCQDCGSRKNLHAHHIKSFSKNESLRYEVSNGKTVCQNCHSKIHGRFIPNTGDIKRRSLEKLTQTI